MFELRTGHCHEVIVDTADTQDEALTLARFYCNDPRDPAAPARIFVFDARALQYAGWAVRSPRDGQKGK